MKILSNKITRNQVKAETFFKFLMLERKKLVTSKKKMEQLFYITAVVRLSLSEMSIIGTSFGPFQKNQAAS